MSKKVKQPEYIFINKGLFFPKQGILALGDLHLGYESMLKEQGMALPFNQNKITQEEVKFILNEINFRGYSINKIVLLGDVKHYFRFEKSEFFEIRNFLKSLLDFVKEKDIILIKGNHDKAISENEGYRDFYISDDEKICFIHGHKNFPEIHHKSLKIIVMSHLHPAVILKDPQGIKKEKYKSFLVGKYKNKKFIIVPSFFPLIEGSEINEFYSDKFVFSIIPNEILKKFNVYVVGKNKVYEFGKLGDLN
ncbi:MAG: metallophosphoesterase [Nanoarchaeota archaeon]